MKYKEINLDAWDRGKVFRFFIDRLRNVMSMTVDIDVAPLVAFAKTRGLKFYPTMMWVVAKVVNFHDEFKYGWSDDGKLIRWECFSPYYADFHEETKVSSSCSPNTRKTWTSFTAIMWPPKKSTRAHEPLT